MRGVFLKIAILGAGAIGCFFGGLLAKENCDVTFIAKKRTLKRLEQHDLIVKSIRGDFALPVPVLDAAKLEGPFDFDLIVLAVKSTALEEVIPQIQQLADEDTKIICLLNGIGNEERLTEIFGSKRIVGGSAFISVIREAPGIVNHVGEGTLILGEWQHEADSELLNDLAAKFKAAGIRIQINPNIRQIKWEKLLWNITYNPLTALTGTRVGEVLTDPNLREILETVKKEYLQVAQSAGIVIGSDYIDALLLPNKEVQNHKTSMLQDFEAGREMELEAILGFVVETAEHRQVPVPTIKTLYHLLTFAQRKSALEHSPAIH